VNEKDLVKVLELVGHSLHVEPVGGDEVWPREGNITSIKNQTTRPTKTNSLYL
jgi:hypothetical protein